jgi:L-Ala-D/L-Glu epimerase
LISPHHIVRVEPRIVEIPLRHTFATAKDILERQVSYVVEIAVETEDGGVFTGEAVPVTYVTGETPESVVSSVKDVGVALLGKDSSRLQPLVSALREALPHSPTARAGIEIALYSGLAERIKMPLWKLLGGAVTQVETDITLSIVPDVVDRAVEAHERGFRLFKMKVGSADPEADFARLLALDAALPDATFRLDANQAFTADGALEFIGRAIGAGIRLQMVEQPVPKEDLEALDVVAANSPVPIIADEAVKSPADALRLVRETRVHGINVKLMKAGIAGALEIVAIARAANRQLMIGCMLETRRGIAASLAVACGTGAFDYVDLDSHMLLREEGENPWFDQQGSRMSVTS